MGEFKVWKETDLPSYRFDEEKMLKENLERNTLKLGKLIEKLPISKKDKKKLTERITYQQGICSRLGYLYGVNPVKKVRQMPSSFKEFKAEKEA